MAKNIFKTAVFCLCLLICSNAAFAVSTEVRDKAVNFSAVDINGNNVEFNQYLGKDAVLLVFFATWCPPCREEVPELKHIEEQYASKGLRLIAVSVDASLKVLPRFIEKNNINYTVWQGSQGARTYNVVGIPTNILINKNGEISYRGNRPPTAKEIAKVLD